MHMGDSTTHWGKRMSDQKRAWTRFLASQARRGWCKLMDKMIVIATDRNLFQGSVSEMLIAVGVHFLLPREMLLA